MIGELKQIDIQTAEAEQSISEKAIYYISAKLARAVEYNCISAEG